MLDTVLIVESDSLQRERSKYLISEKLKYNIMSSATTQEAIDIVLNPSAVPSVMLLDMRFDKNDCLHLLRYIKLHRPDFPIIILVEYGDHNYALEAIEAGANDFLTKPVTIERLGLTIASTLRIVYLCRMVSKLEKQLEAETIEDFRYSSSIIAPPELGGDIQIKKLRSLEEDAIKFALNACGGSMSKAARSLGIGRSTLYRKVSELERHKSRLHILRENQTTRPIMVRSEMEHS